MPLNAPGNLSHAKYVQLPAFLLVQNGDMSATQIFNEDGLNNLILVLAGGDFLDMRPFNVGGVSVG